MKSDSSAPAKSMPAIPVLHSAIPRTGQGAFPGALSSVPHYLTPTPEHKQSSTRGMKEQQIRQPLTEPCLQGAPRLRGRHSPLPWGVPNLTEKKNLNLGSYPSKDGGRSLILGIASLMEEVGPVQTETL